MAANSQSQHSEQRAWWASPAARRIAHAITLGIIVWGVIACYRMMTSDRVIDERFRDFFEFYDAAANGNGARSAA